MNDFEYDEDAYEEYEDEDSEGLILSFGEDGVASLSKPEDWVQVKREEMELIADFLKLKKEEFDEFLKSKKSED